MAQPDDELSLFQLMYRSNRHCSSGKQAKLEPLIKPATLDGFNKRSHALDISSIATSVYAITLRRCLTEKMTIRSPWLANISSDEG